MGWPDRIYEGKPYGFRQNVLHPVAKIVGGMDTCCKGWVFVVS